MSCLFLPSNRVMAFRNGKWECIAHIDCPDDEDILYLHSAFPDATEMQLEDDYKHVLGHWRFENENNG